MGNNRLILAVIYFSTGVFFTYMAIKSIEQTVWELTPIIFLFVATLGFGASFRFLKSYFQIINKE